MVGVTGYVDGVYERVYCQYVLVGCVNTVCCTLTYRRKRHCQKPLH